MTSKPLHSTRFFLAFCGSLLLGCFSAQALEVPHLQGRVNDKTSSLSISEIDSLEKTLKSHEEKTGNQVAVLIIPSLEGEPLESYSLKVVEAWKLGKQKKDNGVLLLVAKNDRKLRIEVGYGLEGVLTDAYTSRVIRNVITPEFRNGQFASGIFMGVEALVSKLENRASEIPSADPDNTAFDLGANDMNWKERIMIGGFIFGILGLFTFFSLFAPFFLYLFLIPFWAIFPMLVVGSTAGVYVLATYVIGIPLIRLFLRYNTAGRKWKEKIMKAQLVSPSSSSGGSGFSSSSSSWSSSSSSGSSFSGGGGSFGGGGSSGSW